MAFTKKKTEKGYRDFLKDLKDGALPSVVLLYGKENFLIDWAARAIKDRFVNKATEVMDYEVLDSEADAGTLLASFATFPMMSERRVVIARDIPPISSTKPRGFSSDDIDRLTEFVEQSAAKKDDEPSLSLLGGGSMLGPIGESMGGSLGESQGSSTGGSMGGSLSTIVVFCSDEIDGRGKLVKAIKKYGSAYEFDTLSEEELEAFAAKRFHAAGLKISRREMSFLIHETGYNNKESEYRLANFDNDIKKIIACCDGGSVTQEAIASTVIGDGDTFIFDLLDGISGNDKKRAFEILGNRLAKDQYEAMQITGSIVSQLELMLEVREINARTGMNSSGISRELSQNEFRVRKALGYANRYSVEKLRSMLENAYDVNKNIVNGLMEPRLALEMFIAGI